MGPSTKTKSIRTAASTRLMVLSHFTPLCRPEKAERTKAADREPMMISSRVTESSTPVVRFSPLETWSAPRPRLVAVPKTVANTASRSMARPAGPPARSSPIRGTKAELRRLPRPLRKVA